MTADRLLARLDAVRRMGDHRWIARCPSHDDRNPSLTIREADDARVLLKCFTECETSEVLDSLGLGWSALFPPRDSNKPRKLRREPLAYPSDALRVLAHEARILVIVAGDLARGQALSEEDHARLLLAANRIAKAEAAWLP